MILPIKHIENWRLICQRNKLQTDKGAILENYTIVDHNNRIEEWVMARKENDFKYNTPFKCPYEIVQT